MVRNQTFTRQGHDPVVVATASGDVIMCRVCRARYIVKRRRPWESYWSLGRRTIRACPGAPATVAVPAPGDRQPPLDGLDISEPH